MDNFNYTISIIKHNKIERLNYTTEKEAIKDYKIFCVIAHNYTNNIEGVLLWQHAKDKTIDNDPLARIIKQYYYK